MSPLIIKIFPPNERPLCLFISIHVFGNCKIECVWLIGITKAGTYESIIECVWLESLRQALIDCIIECVWLESLRRTLTRTEVGVTGLRL